jgi:hypothetical protein
VNITGWATVCKSAFVVESDMSMSGRLSLQGVKGLGQGGVPMGAHGCIVLAHCILTYTDTRALSRIA